MLNRTLSVILVVLACSIMALSQAVHSPERGSAERKEILAALRVPVEKKLKQTIVFSAEHFNVSGSWAFVGGQPQNAEGGRPNYKGTPYEHAEDEGMFDNNFFALLKKTSGKWRVVTYSIGCTDVCYADWWRRYKAPKAIFPYTE